MTQKEFLQKLSRGIVSLPKGRIKEIQEDMQQHFHEGLSNGESEVQIAEMLGDPTVLASEYTELYFSQCPRPERGPLAMIGRAIGMFFFNLIIMLPIWLLALCFWLIFAMGLLIAIGGGILLLGVIVQLILPNVLFVTGYPLISVFGSLAMMSLGSLMFMAAVWIGRRLVRLLKKNLLWNHRVITGRRNEQ